MSGKIERDSENEGMKVALVFVCVCCVCFIIGSADAFSSLAVSCQQGNLLDRLSGLFCKKNFGLDAQVRNRRTYGVAPSCVLSDGPIEKERASQIGKWKSLQLKNPYSLKTSLAVSQISSTLQSLLIQGLKTENFDRDNIEFLISLLTQANAPFNPLLLGDGPWQAVSDILRANKVYDAYLLTNAHTHAGLHDRSDATLAAAGEMDPVLQKQGVSGDDLRTKRLHTRDVRLRCALRRNLLDFSSTSRDDCECSYC